MKNRWMAMLAVGVLSLGLLGPAAATELKPLTVDSYSQLLAAHAGEGRLLVFWSEDCPPCHKELATLGKLWADSKELPLTLISTDFQLPPARVQAILARYQLEGSDAWVFADPVPARLRQAIDPAWHGELPRSYYLAADGSRQAHSGLLSPKRLRAWLDL